MKKVAVRSLGVAGGLLAVVLALVFYGNDPEGTGENGKAVPAGRYQTRP